MASSRILISSQTLGSSQASVTFSSIPSTYQDLSLVYSARSDQASAQDVILLQMNTDTGSNYSSTRLYGNGSTAGSTRQTNYTPPFSGYLDGSTATSNTFGSGEIYIPSYTASQNKPWGVSSANEDNNATAFIGAYADLWRSTAAITQLVLSLSSTMNFVSGSTFYLYGINK